MNCIRVFLLLVGSLMLATAADRPNVIVILADDLGFGDLSCFGHTKFKTPNLDRMAKEGAKLTQFNTPMPFCGPTRASLMTGRFPFRSGMNGNPAPDGGPQADAMVLQKSEILLPELFKKAGYATGMVGKWHLGHQPGSLPVNRGFDEYLGILYSNDMRPTQLVEGDKAIEYPLVQANLMKRYTERVTGFLDRNRSKSFFLYFAPAMPHKPLAASEDFYKKSGAGLYGDALAELDWGIGQILAKLKELALDQKTLIVFTSDNGPWFGGSSGGLRGMKGSTYEGGYRVPCIARWPGKIPAGMVNHSIASMMDIFTTVLKAANISAPTDRVIDGKDIMALFTSTGKGPHEATFGQQGARLAMVRDDRWKLHVLSPVDRYKEFNTGTHWIDPRGPDGVTIIAQYEQPQPSEYPGAPGGDAPKAMQLFDLKVDPAEQQDVAAKNPDVVKRLKAAFDRLNKDVPQPPPAPKGGKAK